MINSRYLSIESKCEELFHNRIAVIGNFFSPMVVTEQVNYEVRLGPIEASLYDYSSTATIFDWDDTLICTSYLKNQMKTQSTSQLKELCDSVDGASADLITRCLQLGRVIIITNAALDWVHFSASRFLPSVSPLLKKLTLISARDLFAAQHPNDPSTWKRRAFKSLRFRETNLISIGDSIIDLQALLTLRCPSLMKTVKFKSNPTPQELLTELILLKSRFRTIAVSPTPLRVSMTERSC